MISESTLIFDLETRKVDKYINAETDIPRYYGFYSYKTKKYYKTTDVNEFLNAVNKHDVIVGFNNFGYDNTVLHSNGLHSIINKRFKRSYFKNKLNVDLYEVTKKRRKIIKTVDGDILDEIIENDRLGTIVEALDLVGEDEGKIDDFDYDVLQNDFFTEEQAQYIEDYLQRDLEITKKYYEFLENYFECFKEFLSVNDVEKKLYLTSSVADYSYSVVCNELGWAKEYLSDSEKEETDSEKDEFDGAYVSYPAFEEIHGCIRVIDIGSAYPHAYGQCNLLSHTTDRQNNFWHGGLFKVDGYYDNQVLGKVEQLFMKLFRLRKQFKKLNDRREFALKIVINTLYGICGKRNFKLLYNIVTAGDCTGLVRQWIKLARTMLKENGYKLIYTDTDSVYILDPFNDEKRFLDCRDAIVNKIKENVPFPQETFNIEQETKITDMWFFKGENKSEKLHNFDDEDDLINKKLGLMKKNYMYLDVNGKLVVKSLAIKRRNCSKLSRKIFNEILVPKIKAERNIKFSKAYLHKLITNLLEEDISLLSVRKNIREESYYKDTNSQPLKISKMYGAGIHQMIRNTRCGVGNDAKLCTLQEFKEKNLSLNDVDLSGVWKELKYFIQEDNKMDLSVFGL